MADSSHGFALELVVILVSCEYQAHSEEIKVCCLFREEAIVFSFQAETLTKDTNALSWVNPGILEKVSAN